MSAEEECTGLDEDEIMRQPLVEGDPWEDVQGLASLSDEAFDEELSTMVFSGANKVLRFVVPLKSRKGPQILAGLQEVVTECNRLGYPVKVAHTDRAKELMSKATMDWLQSKLIQPSFTQGDDPKSNGLAERLVGWVKARARLHLASSGLGVEQWPAAMAFACAEHRHRILQGERSLPRFGQKVIFKSKHPTGKSKRPFIRWEHAVYLCPTPRTEGGHVLMRAASGGYLVAKNVRCVEDLVDPEAEFEGEGTLQADPVAAELPEPAEAISPSRRVTGKRSVKAVMLPAETLAEDLLKRQSFAPDDCGQLLELAFGSSVGVTRRQHRGQWEFSVILGAYSHGGLRGITRASAVHASVCRYLNEYLRRHAAGSGVEPCWTSLMVVVADEVSMHRDVRNEPGSTNYAVQVSTRQMWLEQQTQEEQVPEEHRPCYDAKGREFQGAPHTLLQEAFERGFSRWQRVLEGRMRDPELYLPTADGRRLLAYVFEFSDDGYADDSPLPDRMLMFSVRDTIRDVVEMVILRVELIHEPAPQEEVQEPVLEVPGPNPPEVMAVAVAHEGSGNVTQDLEASRLPIPLPNPTHLKEAPEQVHPCLGDMATVYKAEATTTRDLEGILASLTEPLSVTHTASQEEVRSNLELWRPAIEKELQSLKGQGVLVSHFGSEARAMMANPDTSVISLKGVFTAKAPSGPGDGLFKRKCRLVGCGNQSTHVDADSLYAAGAPSELVRSALVQAARHRWSAYTTDIKSAFTQTPIPKHAASRYLLRPPRWLVDLGLAQADEYYSLGMVLYGFKEAPAWWSDHRDARLLTAKFLGCHLEQGRSDPSIWKIMKGSTLQGYLVTYVDDFLILSDRKTAEALHQWLLDVAGWETDGLSEASPGHPVRLMGMQLHGYEDGHYSLDQEAYVDELVRAYGLKEGDKSKIVCPKELLMVDEVEAQPFDEATTRAAQRIAGECLWLAQRSRIDICFATTVLCSRVSKDPHGALAIGRRILHYLHFSKDFRLHLLPDESAAPVRVFTDASFSPQGHHSFGGHVVEVYGAPVLWKASRQALIALSSSESELIQAVEGCMYTESLMTVLGDLGLHCTTAELHLDNTAPISFISGAGNQRTRHLKVRGHKVKQLVEAGWTVKHCPGQWQKADLLTKVLPSARLLFLCGLLHLGSEGASPEEESQMPSVRTVTSSPPTPAVHRVDEGRKNCQ
ncbi:GIP, partial [Symbiodinium sp. CCMP2456]